MDYSKSGFIYVIQMQGHPYYKIGRTNNVDRRMSQITPLLPTAHNLIAYYEVEDAVRAERVMHEEFRAERMNGEWFRLASHDIRYIHACCLCGQAFRLCRNLMSMLTARAEYAISPYAFKVVKVMVRASARMRRRQLAFLGRSFDRQMRTCVDEDVLESEFIG